MLDSPLLIHLWTLGKGNYWSQESKPNSNLYFISSEGEVINIQEDAINRSYKR